METATRAGYVRFIPHALSMARVALVLVTYAAAWRQDKPLFATLVLLTVLTDIMDGPLARHFGTASRFGANVDSASDFIFYVSLPVWTYLFAPEVVVENLSLILALVVLYVGANVISHAMFGALGVHNRLSRASGTMGVVATFYVILWGLHPVVFVGIVAMLAADLAQRYGAIVQAARKKQRADPR